MPRALDLHDGQRDAVVVEDRADRDAVDDRDIAAGRAERDGEALVALADRVGRDRDADRAAIFARGEADRPGERGAREQIGGIGGGVEVDRIIDAGRAREAARAMDGEGQDRGAASAFDDARIVDAQLADVGSRAEALPGVGATGRAGFACGPAEVVVARAAARELERGTGRRIDLLDPDIDAGLARGRTIGRGHRAFVAEELDDAAEIIDQRDAVGGAILDAVVRARQRDEAEAVGGVAQDARQRDRRVGRAAIAVVEHHAPAGEVGPGETGQFEEFAGVGARRDRS